MVDGKPLVHRSTSFSRRSTLSSLESKFQWNQDCHWEDFIGIEFIGNKFHWNKFIGSKLHWDKFPLGAISVGEISLGQNSIGTKFPRARHGQWAMHSPRHASWLSGNLAPTASCLSGCLNGAISHPWLETLSGSQPQVQLRRGRHWKFSCSATS